MIARTHIPNFLTFARVLAVPVCLAIILLQPVWVATALLWIFIAASLTDFFDGALARHWNVISPLGTMLDPIADKLLVALMLIFLLVNGHTMLMPMATPSPYAAMQLPLMLYSSPLFLPVVVILLRELYVSGLREFLANRHIPLPVSKSGKLKTALQMLAITLLLVQLAYEIAPSPLYCAAPLAAPFSEACGHSISPLVSLATMLGLPLLYASALLSFTSAVSYTRAALKAMR